ncbi:MAG: hypothetical protein JSW51_04650 [Gemmatimonadota bacterium]|nr:MAG: hypothetical protein JSW51_04650 [Gemmatimonadota bacterium]
MVNPRRVKFTDLELEYLSDKVLRATVTLEWKEETYRGTAETEWIEHQELICCAKAACLALEAVTAKSKTEFEYLQCEPVTAVGQVLAVAAVAIGSAVSHQYMVGASQIKDSPGDSAVRAVLCATNRLQVGEYREQLPIAY